MSAELNREFFELYSDSVSLLADVVPTQEAGPLFLVPRFI